MIGVEGGYWEKWTDVKGDKVSSIWLASGSCSCREAGTVYSDRSQRLTGEVWLDRQGKHFESLEISGFLSYLWILQKSTHILWWRLVTDCLWETSAGVLLHPDGVLHFPHQNLPHCRNRLHFAYLFHCGWISGLIPFGAITSSTAMTIFVHAFLLYVRLHFCWLFTWEWNCWCVCVFIRQLLISLHFKFLFCQSS